MDSKERSELKFAESVTHIFRHLADFGFVKERSDTTLVVYANARIRIYIYHGRRSFEIGFEIEERLNPQDRYSMSSILQLLHNPSALTYRMYAARDAEGVLQGLQHLSDLLTWCIEMGLLVDQQLFTRLCLQRETASQNYELEMRLQQMRTNVTEAWDSKDYITVVRLLKPFEEALTPSERLKLQVSEKRC